MSDSAGVPWAGRAFHANPGAGDDGSAPAGLLETIARFRSRELDAGHVVAALVGKRLLLPLMAAAGDTGVGAHGQLVDKTQELALVTTAGPDGRPVLPAFSSVETMRAWNPAARPIPVETSRIALALAAEGTQLLVLDPGSSSEFVVRHPAFASLALGEPWTPPDGDPAVREAFLASARGEVAVRDLQLVAGDPEARLRGTELRVLLGIAPDLAEDELAALLSRLGERWSTDPVIAARVDSITVAPAPVS